MIACPNLVGSVDSYLARGGQTGSLSVSHILQNRMLWQQEQAHHGPITALAWSQDGRLLASAGADGWVHVWQTTTGTRLCSCEQQERVQRLLWSAQGTLAIASGTVIRLWPVPSAQAKRWPPHHPVPSSLLPLAFPSQERAVEAGKEKHDASL